MVGHHRRHHHVGKAIEQRGQQHGISLPAAYNVAQYAVHENHSPHIARHKNGSHQKDGEIVFGLRHHPVVYPIERKQHGNKQRVAQRVPVQAHARYEYEREDVVARHVQVVVEHRPEPHMRSARERVVMVVYQQSVKHGEHRERHNGDWTLLFSYS